MGCLNLRILVGGMLDPGWLLGTTTMNVEVKVTRYEDVRQVYCMRPFTWILKSLK